MIGTVVRVKNFSIKNNVGGTTVISHEANVKITEEFNDDEIGQRYIGELVDDKDIAVARECGQASFSPDHYKMYGEEMYQDTLKAFNDYNPKKVYFAETDIV